VRPLKCPVVSFPFRLRQAQVLPARYFASLADLVHRLRHPLLDLLPFRIKLSLPLLVHRNAVDGGADQEPASQGGGVEEGQEVVEEDVGGG
jgi:hypothetical protein